jgi:hypothetical protein
VIAVVEDRGLIGATDGELLGHATSIGRCLVTANVRDFASLHASWTNRGRSHAGIVYIVNRVFPNDRSFLGAVATALDALLGSGVLPSDGGEFYLRR